MVMYEISATIWNKILITKCYNGDIYYVWYDYIMVCTLSMYVFMYT